MKKISVKFFFIICLFLCNTPIINAQQDGQVNKMSILDYARFRVLYQFNQLTSIENDHFVQTDTMVLIIGNTYSQYSTHNKTVKDSLLGATKIEVDLRRKVVKHYGTYEDFASNLNNKSNVGLWTRNWETADLFKNRQNGKLTIIDELDDGGFIKVEETISPLEWEIGTDTMNIIGYACRDASVHFKGREFTAWFAPDIPINDGPWKFYGSPGLILQIEDKDKLFKFTAIGIEVEKDETPISIDGSKKYQEPTLKQYNRMKTNNKKDARYFSLQGSELNMFSGENRTKYYQIEIEE